MPSRHRDEPLIVADLKINGHHDMTYYSFNTESDIKHKENRLRRVARNHGMEVTIVRMRDDEGRFLRATRVAR